MGSWQGTYTCPSSLSSKTCGGPLTMFTWRLDLIFVLDLLALLDFLDLLDLFAWTLDFIGMESKRMGFSGQPETKNLRRSSQVCQERRKAAAGEALALVVAPVLALHALMG